MDVKKSWKLRRGTYLHIEHWSIQNVLSGYVECDSQRDSRCQDVVEAGKPFASVVDWIQEGREDALYPEEDEHGNEQQYLTGNVDFVARSVTEEAVVRTDHGSQ